MVFVVVQCGSRVRHTQEHKTRQAPLHCESLLLFAKQVRTAAPAVGGFCGLSCAQEVLFFVWGGRHMQLELNQVEPSEVHVRGCCGMQFCGRVYFVT